jgi:hypothetical protein
LISLAVMILLVIPAKAGIHLDLLLDPKEKWIPAFAGMTDRWRLSR